MPPAIAARPPAGTNRWTKLIGAGMAAMLKRRARLLSDHRHWAYNTAAVQHAQLRTLIDTAKHTEFGKAHHFESLLRHTGDDLARAYKDAVPIAGYEAFRPFVERMRTAEPDVLWPGVVRDWAQTSGTTSGEKFIPVSQQMMRSNRTAAFDIFAHSMRAGVSLQRLFGGKMLFLGGCTDVTTNEHGIRTGDLSGLVTPLIRWPLTEVYTPGPDVALESHWPTKLAKIVERCLSEDIRFVSGMASWSLLLFDEMVATARSKGAIPADGTLRDLWPNLTTFVHGGVRYPPFDPRVRLAWSGSADTTDPTTDLPHRLEVYPASEGFIALQDKSGDPGLRLLTDIGVFYEFVPVENVNPERPDDIDPATETFDATQVEKGQRYVVCMSTCAGLWRYLIGDVVEFDTIPPDGPARLRIVGRHRHFINAFGENLIVENIEDAAVRARDTTGLTIGEFTASPVYPTETTPSGLELVVETEPDADPDTLRAFRDAFDRALRDISVDYNTKRTDSYGMGDPTLTAVPLGTFNRWMDSRGKLGGQNKVPRCANHRDFVDGIRSDFTPVHTIHGGGSAAPA